MNMDTEASSRRPRRLLRWGRRMALSLVICVATFFGYASWYAQHIPYTIEPGDRAPEQVGPPRRGLTLRYLGVTCYSFSDGQTTVVTDPCLTRPTIPGLLTGPLQPDDALARELVPRADYVLINHAHYDHCVDMPGIARRTGATVVGTTSACNLARARGIPEDRIREVKPGERLQLGSFAVDVRESHHPPVLGMDPPMAGIISPQAGALWFWQYRLDVNLTFRLSAAGTTVWFHPTSTFRSGELGGLRAQTLIVGINGQAMTKDKARAILAECRPTRVLPTHYDNFFQPYRKGLALMPDLDLGAARKALVRGRKPPRFFVLDLGQSMHLPPDDAR